jgi:hypothetical protein
MIVSLYSQDFDICKDLRSEEGSQDVADQATNTVYSEDIECVVASEEVLQLRGVVASDTTADTEDDCGPGGDVSGSRGDGN